MMKPGFFSDCLIFFVYLSGIGYASIFWPWARVLMVLWFILGLVGWSKRNEILSKWYTLAFFVMASCSVWSFAFRYIPYLPFPFVAGTWLCLAGFVSYRYFHPKKHDHSPLLSVEFVSCILVFAVGGWMVLHWILNGYLGKPFDWGWWTSPTWAVIAIMIFYPERFPRSIRKPEWFMAKYLAPILILLVLGIHWGRYSALSNRLEQRSTVQGISAQAFRSGYQSLGIQAAIRETLHIQEEDGWPSAVRYLREQWANANKVAIAKAWRSHPVAAEDLFFFATCFGCNLVLQPDEEAVDFTVLPKEQAYIILTSKGRLLRLDSTGIECIFTIPASCFSLAGASGGDRFAVLADEYQIHIIDDQKNLTVIPLLEKRQWGDQTWDGLVWKDLAFSRNGNSLFVLDDHGTIEMYYYVFLTQSWVKWREPFYPPLWAEAGMAQAILPSQKGNSVLLMDRVGGVHWRGDPAMKPENFTTDNMMKYYNTNLANKKDLTFWKNGEQLILLSDTCRLDFITTKPLDVKETRGVAGRFDLYVDPIPSIRAELTFDRETGIKKYPSIATAVVSLPQADTIIQLLRNGRLLVFAMPNGVRIHFEENAAKIYIPESDNNFENEEK